MLDLNKEIVRMSDGKGNVFAVIHVGTDSVPFAVALKVYNEVTRKYEVVNSWTRRSEKAARRLAWEKSHA